MDTENRSNRSRGSLIERSEEARLPRAEPAPDGALTLVGRSSSHFTRCVRIVAHEVGLTPRFRIVANLLSRDAAEYAGNPALRMPILVAPNGTWFGALAICRELWRSSARTRRIVWPEALE